MANKFKISNFQLDLRLFFSQATKTLIASYKNLLSKRQGVRLDDAPQNANSTIARKGKDHWLVETGETKNRGFLSRFTKTMMEVFASPQRHSGKTVGGTTRKNAPSYEKIFGMWNTAGGRYSGIFGQVPANSRLFQRLDKEMNIQFQKHLTKTVPKIVKIGKK